MSYTLVTTAALAGVEILALGVLGAVVNSPKFLLGLAAKAVIESAPQVYPFLKGDVSDIPGLESWLLRARQSGFASENGAGLTVSFVVGELHGQGDLLAVADARGRVLAAEPPPAMATAQGMISSDPALHPLITAALAGVTDPGRLHLLTPQGRLIVTAPIRSPEGRVAGLLVVASQLPPVTSYYRDFLAVLGASLVLFVLGAGTLGTVFGFFTARGLVRRLNRIVQASDSWRQGHFQLVIQDDSGDELGQVARCLNSMAAQLQGLMQARKELGILEERNRLARELHDSVKQQVFAIAMQLGSARTFLPQDPQRAETHLARAAELAHQAQAELANLIQALRPLCLQEQGLARALQAIASEWSLQTAIAAIIHVQDVGGLPPSVEQAFLRVAQEGLANVARHSGARTVWLSLVREGNQVRLQVIDDGRGFDEDAARAKGMGLRNMRERMEGAGGNLFIDSALGRGTRLLAVWPGGVA
ncbi:MAG: HAMP domain-containing protein [Limnochordaceae bacterium]|nr:HAMP domain-containing protein [Limnochordaceae bacterium]